VLNPFIAQAAIVAPMYSAITCQPTELES